MNAQNTLDKSYLDRKTGVSTGFYSSYSDIKTGNVIYYIDNIDNSDNDFAEIFSKNTTFTHKDYVDLNGVYKPYYRLTNSYNPNCLTFIADSNRIRSDLIFSSMQKRLQQKYN
jgi:hypothetical protein